MLHHVRLRSGVALAVLGLVAVLGACTPPATSTTTTTTTTTTTPCSLAGANLSAVDLSGVSLTNCDLSNVNLANTVVQQLQLNKACGSDTKLPLGLTLKPCPHPK